MGWISYVILACAGGVLISIAGIMFICVEMVPKDHRYGQEMQQTQQQQQQQQQTYPHEQRYATTIPMT